MLGYAHFCMDTPILRSIDCITLNSTPSCSLHAYISSLRYEAIKFRSTFDYCGDMAGPIISCFRRPCFLQVKLFVPSLSYSMKTSTLIL